MAIDLNKSSVPELFIEGMNKIKALGDISSAFGMTDQQWDCFKNTEKFSKYIDSIPEKIRTNPDVFYSVLYMGLACGFDATKIQANANVQQLIHKEYPFDIFSRVHNKFNKDIPLQDEFRRQAEKFCKRSDDELRVDAQAVFDVTCQSLLASAQSKNFIFTKINHGYWEHFLSIYASSFTERSAAGDFRELNQKIFESSYSASGMDSMLGLMIGRLVGQQSSRSGGVTRLAINYSAGEKTFARTLSRPLSPVGRAAMAGSLAFFKSVTNDESIALGDGSEAKKLIDDREFVSFAQEFVSDASAVLFVVPPHLKDIVVKGGRGNVYKMIVPRKFAHETWRVTLPVFASLVQRLAAKHQSLTILTQAAVLAPILGLILTRILPDAANNSSIRFFDLGRVLDVAAPAVTSWQPWFKPYADIPLEELSPFVLDDNISPPKLLYC